MKFHALLPVREEADILPQCLSAMLEWADSIYIFDTGSEDESWEIANKFAQQDRRVVLLDRKPVYYDESSVRSELFHRARSNFKDGDWVLRVDADEFHHISPPSFVAKWLRPGETSVWHQYYEFVQTDREALLQQERDPATLKQIRKVPIEQRLRDYVIFDYAEPRMFRYRKSMCWPSQRSCPYNMGFVAQQRIPIRHYPNRDLAQMKRRCTLRNAIMERKLEGFAPDHWMKKWEDFIYSPDDNSVLDWKSDTDLALVNSATHLAGISEWKLRVRQVPGAGRTYNLLASILDFRRRAQEFSSGLRSIPADHLAKIEEALRS